MSLASMVCRAQRTALSRALGVALMSLAATSCGGRPDLDEQPDPETDQRSPAQLDVTNSHWLDVVIFVLHEGELSRVGTVTAASSGTFTVPRWMLGQSRNIRLIADPVGSGQVLRTELINVQPGQLIEWRLESQLARSTVSVY